MVTIRIRSWRPAMPSISGPRSTVASNFTVTPFVSGDTCSLLIVHSPLYFQDLTCELCGICTDHIGVQLLADVIESLSMKEMGASFLNKCANTFAEIMFDEATVKAFTHGN